MVEPLLTICIPTYRRLDNLKQILDQLKTQYNEKAVILIADDYPLDALEMQKLIADYKEALPNLVLQVNEANLGFSRNVCQLYETATTKYVWFLCDDDTVLPDAVSKIIFKLEKYNPSVAIFDYTWIDSYGVMKTAGVKEDKAYLTVEDVKNYNILMRQTFLSCLVMERNIDLSDLKSKDYSDNVFFQITLGLQILSARMALYEFSDCILHRNVGYKYGEFFKFYIVDHFKAITILNNVFDPKKFIQWSRKEIHIAFELYMSQKLGLFVYMGTPTDETIKNVYKFYGKFYGNIILAFRTMYKIIPAFVFSIYYYLILVFKHGIFKAHLVYRENVNRAFKDERLTGYTEYR